MIDTVKREIGDYHVIVKGDIKENSTIKKIKIKDGRNYITFNNIGRVYINTEKICKSKCESITYNDSLLSLYGISKNENILNTYKKIIYFLVISFSVIVFIIIYNSFKVSINTRKRDICLYKLSGCTNYDVYKIIIKESLLLGLIGMVLGFIISLILNTTLINILNSILYEIFNGRLSLKIYLPFIIIPFIFMTLVIVLSSSFPLKNIKKYRPIELFKAKDDIYKSNVKRYKNIPLWLSIINYQRGREKYKSLIICIFISVLSINIFSLTLNYGLKCIEEYVITPDYDLFVNVEGDYNLEKLSEDLKSEKTLIYKSCEYTSHIPKDYYLKESKEKEKLLITNLKNNEIVNKIDLIDDSNKIKHLKQNIFKNLTEIKIDNEDKIIDNLKLTNKIPFGLKGTENIIVNLDEEKFNGICEYYNSNMFIKTKYKGIDNYLENKIKKDELNMTYYNSKKSKEIMNNIVLLVKIALYGICLLIILVMLTSVINITSSSINYRKKEFSSLQSIGLEKKDILSSLFLESLIVSLKGWGYAVPFIFIINKMIFTSIKSVFDFKNMIINLNILIISLILSQILVFISMAISHHNLKEKSLINNIKDI